VVLVSAAADVCADAVVMLLLTFVLVLLHET
jgi:hypothetical protein